MSFIATAIINTVGGVGSSLFSAYEQSQASKAAQGTLQETTQSGIQQLMQLVNQGVGQVGQYTTQGAQSLTDLIKQAVGQTTPFSGAGAGATSTLLSLLTPGPNQTAALSETPSFQFNQFWGEQGVNNAATASGLGGNALTAGANYASGLASNTWNSIVQALQGLASTGQSAASTAAGALQTGGLSLGSLFGGAGQSIGGLLSGAGQNISSLITGMGQNVAQTQIGQANAIAGGAQGVGSSFGNLSNMLLLSKLLGGKTGTTAGSL